MISKDHTPFRVGTNEWWLSNEVRGSVTLHVVVLCKQRRRQSVQSDKVSDDVSSAE